MQFLMVIYDEAMTCCEGQLLIRPAQTPKPGRIEKISI
jgi:hypothetical protein